MQTIEYFTKARELGNLLLEEFEINTQSQKAFDDLVEQVIDIIRFTVYGDDNSSCSYCRGCCCGSQDLKGGL